MALIEIRHLKKYYKDVKAVDDISFTVGEGEFFAFLGVNGAGKSTTISILCGEEKRTFGCVKIEGEDIEQQPFYALRGRRFYRRFDLLGGVSVKTGKGDDADLPVHLQRRRGECDLAGGEGVFRLVRLAAYRPLSWRRAARSPDHIRSPAEPPPRPK